MAIFAILLSPRVNRKTRKNTICINEFSSRRFERSICGQIFIIVEMYSIRRLIEKINKRGGGKGIWYGEDIAGYLFTGEKAERRNWKRKERTKTIQQRKSCYPFGDTRKGLKRSRVSEEHKRFAARDSSWRSRRGNWTTRTRKKGGVGSGRRDSPDD